MSTGCVSYPIRAVATFIASCMSYLFVRNLFIRTQLVIHFYQTRDCSMERLYIILIALQQEYENNRWWNSYLVELSATLMDRLLNFHTRSALIILLGWCSSHVPFQGERHHTQLFPPQTATHSGATTAHNIPTKHLGQTSSTSRDVHCFRYNRSDYIKTHLTSKLRCLPPLPLVSHGK